MASIANSLPRKTASIGIAAASTSITLFDFSSIRLRQQHSGEQQGRRKSRVWPPRAVSARPRQRGRRRSSGSRPLRPARPRGGAGSRARSSTIRVRRIGAPSARPAPIEPAERGPPNEPPSTGPPIGAAAARAGRASCCRRGRLASTTAAGVSPVERRPAGARARSSALESASAAITATAGRSDRSPILAPIPPNMHAQSIGNSGPSRKNRKAAADSTVAMKSRRAITNAACRSCQAARSSLGARLAHFARRPPRRRSRRTRREGPGRSIDNVSIPAPPSISALEQRLGAALPEARTAIRRRPAAPRRKRGAPRSVRRPGSAAAPSGAAGRALRRPRRRRRPCPRR